MPFRSSFAIRASCSTTIAALLLESTARQSSRARQGSRRCSSGVLTPGHRQEASPDATGLDCSSSSSHSRRRANLPSGRSPLHHVFAASSTNLWIHLSTGHQSRSILTCRGDQSASSVGIPHRSRAFALRRHTKQVTRLGAGRRMQQDSGDGALDAQLLPRSNAF